MYSLHPYLYAQLVQARRQDLICGLRSFAICALRLSRRIDVTEATRWTILGLTS